MTRTTLKIPGFPIDFPVERLWENERPSWEGDIGEDPLGDDLEGRLWAVRLAIKNGLAPKDAPSALIDRNSIEALRDPLELSDLNPTVDGLWWCCQTKFHWLPIAGDSPFEVYS